MRLHVDAVARHFFFVYAEDLAQTVEFRAHFVQNLADRVHFDVAMLVAFHRKTNGDVLGQLQEHGFVCNFRRRLRRQSRQGLADRKAGATRKSRKPRLKGRCFKFVLGRLSGPGNLPQHLQNTFEFVFVNRHQSGFDRHGTGATTSIAAAANCRGRIAPAAS